MESLPQPTIDLSRVVPGQPGPDWAVRVAVSLGYLPDVPLEHHVIQPSDSDANIPWSFDILGIPLCPSPDDPAQPPDAYAFSYAYEDGPLLWLRVITLRVTLPRSNVFVEKTYRADGSIREDICGVNTCRHDGTPYNRMMRDARNALTAIGATFPATGPGRPLGSSQPVTVEDVTREYWQWVEDHGKPPTQDDPAFTRIFNLESRQFKARLKQLREQQQGFQWPPTQPEPRAN